MNDDAIGMSSQDIFDRCDVKHNTIAKLYSH